MAVEMPRRLAHITEATNEFGLDLYPLLFFARLDVNCHSADILSRP